MPPHRTSSAIVVVNYGSARLLAENLAPLSRDVRDSALEVACIVVDNFSSAEERTRIDVLSTEEGWELVRSDANLGFGGGVNLGVQRAAELGASRLLLLNPDAVLRLEAVVALDQAAAASPRTLFAPVVLRSDGTLWSTGSTLDLSDGRIRGGMRSASPTTAPWLSGACLALTMELWDAVGGLADEYFLYWEDVEFSYRVSQAGGTLVVLEDVTAIHDDGGTQRTEPRRDRGKSAAYYYFNIRNHLLFAARNLSSSQLEDWLRASPAVSWEIMLRGGRRQFLYRPFSLFSALVRGRRDGRRIARLRLAGGGR